MGSARSRMNVSRFLVLSLVTALCSRGVEAQDSPKVDPLQGIGSATAIAVRPGGNRERHELYVPDDEAGSVKRISSDSLDQSNASNTCEPPQFISVSRSQAPF